MNQRWADERLLRDIRRKLNGDHARISKAREELKKVSPLFLPEGVQIELGDIDDWLKGIHKRLEKELEEEP